MNSSCKFTNSNCTQALSNMKQVAPVPYVSEALKCLFSNLSVFELTCARTSCVRISRPYEKQQEQQQRYGRTRVYVCRMFTTDKNRQSKIIFSASKNQGSIHPYKFQWTNSKISLSQIERENMEEK